MSGTNVFQDMASALTDLFKGIGHQFGFYEYSEKEKEETREIIDFLYPNYDYDYAYNPEYMGDFKSHLLDQKNILSQELIKRETQPFQTALEGLADSTGIGVTYWLIGGALGLILLLK